MKTLKILLLVLGLLLTTQTFAQNTPLKKESLPIDKKTNCYIRYHYFPNLQAYFDNLQMVYYFKDKGEWKTATELPVNYGGYSLYNKARVVIDDYDDDRPYDNLSVHKKKFPYNSKGRFANNTTESSD
ncbi:hypothetical protein [Flavobacterium sp.]|jgi:hypothetical protein|uniref:hypothetical protein n=1 Tax=Flavobacterium sp. TaxID=239 RepID=UPI0037C01556